MGTINYFTSKYITLGIKPYDAEDFAKDPDFMDFVREEYPDEEPEAIIEDYMRMYEEDDLANVRELMKKHLRDIEYFKIGIRNGYYEGFSIDIEDYRLNHMTPLLLYYNAKY